MEMEQLGWNSRRESEFAALRQEGLRPYRIMGEQRLRYLAAGENGTVSAEVTGRFINTTADRGAFPAVGDWVAATPIPGEQKVMIQRVLSRYSVFSRRAVTSGGRKQGQFEGETMLLGGATEEQIIAANIDTVFLVQGLDGNFHQRRIERYLTMAWNTGAVPVLVLNKADLIENPDEILDKAAESAVGVDTFLVSAMEDYGMERFGRYIQPGKTVAFTGSSGVGKSSLINRLLGYERQKVNDVSEAVGKGLHTTTSREMIPLPDGGILIDTPGMREMQFWGSEEDIADTYTDIDTLKQQCRFNNCRHETEPGCAIRAALASGALDPERYGAYQKLMRELHYLETRRRQKERRANRRKQG